jgi:hypothetical protein
MEESKSEESLMKHHLKADKTQKAHARKEKLEREAEEKVAEEGDNHDED